MRYKCTLLCGYCANVHEISGTHCTRIAKMNLAGLICTRYHDKARILIVSSPRTLTSAMHLPTQKLPPQPRFLLLAWLDYKPHQKSGTVCVCVGMYEMHMFELKFMFLRRYSIDTRHILDMNASTCATFVSKVLGGYCIQAIRSNLRLESIRSKRSKTIQAHLGYKIGLIFAT